MAEKRFTEVVNEDAKSTGIRINDAQARALIEKYFAIYPEIRTVFWGDVENALRRTRTLNTPFGRKREFFGRWSDTMLREAYSYIPQSTVGDLGRKAIVNVAAIPNAEFLLNVHDSILVQCDVGAVREVAAAMEAAMAITFNVHDHTVSIPTD